MLLFLLYIFLFIAVLFYLAKTYISESVGCKFVITCFFTLYYIFMPIILILFRESFYEDSKFYVKIIYDTIDIYGLHAWFRTFIVSITGFLVFEGTIKTKLYFWRHAVRIDESYFLRSGTVNGLRKIGFFLLAVGGISLVLLFRDLGGISTALSLGSTIRAYSTSNADYLSALGSVFKTLSGMVVGAGYCFFVVYVTKKKRCDRMMFIVSLILALFYILFNSGRSNLVFLCLTYICGYLGIKKKDLMKPLIFLALIVILGSEFIGTLMDFISQGRGISATTIGTYSMSDNLLSTIIDFSYPYCNILSADYMNETFGFRFFKDYIIWLPSMLPSRLFSLLGINIPNATSLTLETSNYYQMLMRFNGGTPVDFMTAGIRQFPVFGLLINTVLYSYIVKKIDQISRTVHSNYSPLFWVLYIAAFDTMISNDLCSLVKAKLAQIIIFVFLCWRTKRFRLRKQLLSDLNLHSKVSICENG